MVSLRNGRRCGGIGRVQQIGVVGDHDQYDGGGSRRERAAEQAPGAGHEHVDDQADRSRGDRSSREREEERGGKQRNDRRREHADQAALAQRARQVEREHDAERGKQPERIPVGDGVTEPLVGHIWCGVQHVGQNAADQAREAHNRRADTMPLMSHPQIRRARANAPEQEENQE